MEKKNTHPGFPALISLILLFAMILVMIRPLQARQGNREGVLDTLDVVSYGIHIVSIDMAAQEIECFTDVRFTPVNYPVWNLFLELIDLTVDSVEVEGLPVYSWEQESGIIRVPLFFSLDINDTITARIFYHGHPFHEAWGGFHFSGNYAFNLGVGFESIPHNLGKSWFPCLDNFTDRAIYDVFATTEAPMKAIAGGLLQEVVDNGNGTFTYHWHCDESMPTYLASIAIGNYVLVSDTFSGMERDIPVDIYVRPQDSSKVGGTFIHLNEILGVFEQCMGPYSWERVGYTSTAIGAMEHATNIFVPHNTISGNTTYESLMAHELSHMWVGDMVTCDKAEEMWLNEGWASFFALYYELALSGDAEAFKEGMRDTHASVLQYCHTPSGDGSYFPLNAIPQEYTYGMSAYDKGATVTQALRFYLGDSLFFEAVKAYLGNYAFQPANSFQMSEFMAAFTGKDVASFFNNWVFNSGTPHYSVDSFNVTPTGDQYQVRIHVKQKRKGPALSSGFTDSNIMEVMLMDQEWNSWTDTVHFDGETGSTVKMVPFFPVAIFVDPEEKMSDATTDNYKTITSPGDYTYPKTFFQLSVEMITDSVFIQVTHNWAPPDSLKQPVNGLRISDYRYWRVDGILPEGFLATGKFFYNSGSFLDNTLITGSQDSVVILYRKDASEDWQPVDFEQIGLWNIGNLLVHDLQMGEYTLAVWETQVGIPDRSGQGQGFLHAFPNPATRCITIQCEATSKGKIQIYSPLGGLIRSYPIHPGQAELSWIPADGLSAGPYLICMLDNQGRQLAATKILYEPR